MSVPLRFAEFIPSVAVVCFSSSTVRHNGDLNLKQIYDIARTMRPRSIAKALEGTVKEVLGTAQSVGCTVDGQNPHDVIEKIQKGEIVVPQE